ncbi:MAG: APC family permease [Vicinamibacteria bacterium]
MKKASTFQLVFLTYAVICSGAYGLEEMVSASGPGLALVALLVLPLIYAAPVSLACAELSARHPVEGGYYRWVRMAFGDFAGYMAAWLVWLTMFSTNAIFAVLFANYLRFFVPGMTDSTHFAVAVGLVWVTTALNYRGIQLVGNASVVLTILIFLPFLGLTVLGLAQWHVNPFVPFSHPEKSRLGAMGDGFLIAMWLYGGFEKLTVSAEEVENPARAFPIALAFAVPMCALSYFVPTFAALVANADWREWGEAYYTVAAGKVGGPILGTAMAAGGLAANACILLVTILAQSRLPMVLAHDGFFPARFGRTHPRFGSPVASLVLGAVILTTLCKFRFAQLAAIYSMVQSLSYMLIYAALFRLRARSSQSTAAGFRIPLGTAGLALMVAPSVAIAALVVAAGLGHGGILDGEQALMDLVIFASGPLTYLVLRRRPAEPV